MVTNIGSLNSEPNTNVQGLKYCMVTFFTAIQQKQVFCNACGVWRIFIKMSIVSSVNFAHALILDLLLN